MASDINFCQELAIWRNHIHQLHSFSCLYVCIHVCMLMHVYVWVHVRVSVGGFGGQGATPEVILKAWTPCF